MKAKVAQTNIQDAQEICAKIKKEAADEVERILSKARLQAQRIIQEARQEADRQRDQIFMEFDKQLRRVQDKILSSLGLEKKKIILDEKNNFVEQVLKTVFTYTQEFRGSREYPSFLKKTIIEGVGVIDQDAVDVFYSMLDEEVVTEGFMKEVTALAAHDFGKNIIFLFRKTDFKDIGVIVQSQDGRLMYDNRFLARFKRIEDEIRMQLLKEAL